MRDQQLEVKIEDGRLLISIGVDTFCHATEYGMDQYFTGEVKVTDNDVFVQEVAKELSREEEDGTTPIHRMFDKVAAKALENGANGVTVDGE